MALIPCVSNCVHQSEGNCTLDHVTAAGLPDTTSCLYFSEKAKAKPANTAGSPSNAILK